MGYEVEAVRRAPKKYVYKSESKPFRFISYIYGFSFYSHFAEQARNDSHELEIILSKPAS